MTMSRCFSTVFDEPMKAKGFKRKGILYYRIHGDMLQGVTLKTTNPYFVCFDFHPWWMHDLCKEFWDTESYIKKNMWAEQFSARGSYYIAANEAEALEDMGYMRDWIIKDVIPLLDRISTVDDYIEVLMENVGRTRPVEEILGWTLNQYALLYKAWKEQSFENSKQILEQFVGQCVEDELKVNSYITAEQEREMILKRFKVFVSKMEANDYSSFGELYEAECEKMRELLQTHLKLTV